MKKSDDERMKRARERERGERESKKKVSRASTLNSRRFRGRKRRYPWQ